MALMQRVEFNHTSENYYNNLKQRLNNDGIKLSVKILIPLRSLNILIDYDPSTKPKSKSKQIKRKRNTNVIIYYKYFLKNHYMIVLHYLLK